MSDGQTDILVAQGALAIFNRTINHYNIADGTEKVTPSLGSKGKPSATHTESYPGLFTGTGSAYSSWSSAVVASYEAKDNLPPPSVTGGFKVMARATAA